MKNVINRALAAKKRFIALLLAIVASVGTMFAESGTCGDHLTWDLTNGVLTISGTGAMTDWSYSSKVPWYSKRSSITEVSIGNSVTSIGEYAFAYCSGLTSIEIPNSVKSIGRCAFSDCTGLTSIEIPNSVKSIGNSALYECTGLTSVTIGNSVTSIGDAAFYGCSGLTSITIPNSVTSIGEMAFYYCSSLASITIGNSVTSIGDAAFKGCSGLTSITIPNSVTSIGSSAFYHCSKLTSLTIPNSVTSIGENAFNLVPNIIYSGSATGSPWGARSVNGYVDGYLVYSDASKTNLLACSDAAKGGIEIPNSVTSIGEKAFYGCSALTSITIPNSVTSIGDRAFYECTGLTSITIPNSVTSIGNFAFYECTGLTSVAIGNSVTSIGEHAFGDCYNLKSVHISDIAAWCAITFSDYSSNPLYIANHLYLNDIEIKDLVIPNSVTSIGENAFYYCSGLTSVTIPNSVTSIGNYAFQYCSALTSITIPNSVTSIGENAFYYCSALTSITIPNSVTSIGEKAFYGCYDLTSITCEAVEPPTLGDGVFSYVPKTIPLYVPAGSVEKYKAADQWKDFGDNIKPIQAEQIEVVEPKAEPTTNSVVLSWPKKDDAVSYTIVIKKGAETICTLTFNADGQLTGIQFAPSRNGEPQQAPMATLTATGWQYTVSGLEPDTDYKFLISVKNSADTEIFTDEVPFKTKNIPTGIDQTTNDQRQTTNKIIRNGQIFLHRGDKIYTITGAEIQ